MLRVATNARWHDAIACLLFSVVISAVFLPEVRFTRAFFYFDISSLNLPARHWGFEQVRQGFFPQWCRDWGTGFPFVAESQAGICYPPNYIFYLLLPSWKAYTVAYLVHLWLAGCFAFLLFRRWASWQGSVLGALFFALGGRLLIHQIHTARIDLFAWYPFILYWLERYARSGQTRSLLLVAAGMALQMLAGAFQEVVLCQMGIAAFVAALVGLAPQNALRLAAGYGLAIILAIGAAAILILPTAELFRQSVRAGGLERQWAAWGSVAPHVLLTTFVPYLFGHLGTATGWMSGVTPWREMGLYHGVLAVPLAAAGLWAGNRRGAWLLLIPGAVGLVLAAGELHLAGKLLFVTPVLASTRIPARFLFLTGLSLCGLAALGWDAVCERHRGRGTYPMILGTALVLGLLSLGTGWLLYGDVLQGADAAGSKAAAIYQSDFWTRLTDLFSAEVPWTAAILLLGLVAVGLARWVPKTAALVVLLAASIDLGNYARRLYPTIDPSFHDPPQSVAFLRRTFDPPRVQLFNAPTAISSQGYHYTLDPFWAIGECLYWERGLLFDVALITVPSGLPLELARWHDFQERLIDTQWYHQLLGVAAVMTPERLASPALEETPAYVGARCRIYRVKEPAPFAYFCSHAEFVPPGQALQVLIGQPTDPRRRVVLEGTTSEAASSTGPLAFRAASAAWSGPNRLTVRVEAPADGWLVINETDYPGWRAAVDGQEVVVRRANHLFMAVPVSRGTHAVVLRFESAAVQIGSWISGLSLILGLLAWRRGGYWSMAEEARRVRGWWLLVIVGLVLASFLLSGILLADQWKAAQPTLLSVW